MKSSYQKTARDTVIYGGATVLASLIGLIQLPLLTKTLGAYGYGLWSQVNVTVSLLLPFTGLGLAIALVRFLAAEKNREDIQEGFYSIFLVTCGASAVVSLAMFILASPLAVKFFDGEVQIVRITAAIVFVSSLEPIYLNLIRTFQQIKMYSIFTVAEGYGQLGLIALLVLCGYGITSVVLSVLVVKVAIIIILFFLVKSQIGIKKPNFSRMKEFLSLSLPTVPRRMGFWLVTVSDRYIISFFLGVTAVGIYSAAYGLGQLPYSFVSILTFILLVPLSQLYDEGRMEEVTTHLSYSLKYFLAIAIPFVFGAAVLAEPLLRLFSTPEIASQGGIITPLIALAVLILGISNIISNILLLVKKTKIMAYIWIIAAVLNLLLNIMFVPRMGILGAAIATLIAYLLALGLSTYYSFREFRFSIHWLFIAKSLVASVAMSLAIWFMSHQGNLDTILTVGAGVVIYGVGLMLLRGFSKEEIRFFRGLLQKRTTDTKPDDAD